MEIGLSYSRNDSFHCKTVSFVKKAVENLGILATITERDTKKSFPQLIVDGFDVSNLLRKSKNGPNSLISYDLIEKILERTAW